VARTLENGLYLAVLALWVALALALFQAASDESTALELWPDAPPAEIARATGRVS
jgi:hypothetical protein